MDVIKQFAEENAKLKAELQKTQKLLSIASVGVEMGVAVETLLQKYVDTFGCICGEDDCKKRSVYLNYPEANLQSAYIEAMKEGKDFKVISRSRLASSAEEEALVGSVTMDQINAEIAEAAL